MSQNAQKEDYNESYVDNYLKVDNNAELHVGNEDSRDLGLTGGSSPQTKSKDLHEKQAVSISPTSAKRLVSSDSLKSTSQRTDDNTEKKRSPSKFESNIQENTLGSYTSEILQNHSTGSQGEQPSAEFSAASERSAIKSDNVEGTRSNPLTSKFVHEDQALAKQSLNSNFTPSPRRHRNTRNSKNSKQKEVSNNFVISHRSHEHSESSVSMSLGSGLDITSPKEKSNPQQLFTTATTSSYESLPRIIGDRKQKPQQFSVTSQRSTITSNPGPNRQRDKQESSQKLPEIPSLRKPAKKFSVAESIERLSNRKGKDTIQEKGRWITQTVHKEKFEENWTRVNSDNRYTMSGITIPGSLSSDHNRSRHGPSHSAVTDESLPFLKEDQYTNVILVVEGKKLYTNRCILGYCSPHFQKLLDNAAKAATADKKKKAEVKISDRSYSDMVELLNYLHPATSSEVSEKSALRLLPMANDYGITALKERCDRILVGTLRKSQVSPKASKGPPTYRSRRDNAPDMLLKCIKCADAADSKGLMEECVRIFSNPDVPLKDLKASTDVSDQVKARIFENRMENTASKVNRLQSELTKEKQQNEALQKQIQERMSISNSKNRNNRIQRIGSDPSLDAHRKYNHPIASNGAPQQHHYQTQRTNKTPRT